MVAGLSFPQPSAGPARPKEGDEDRRDQTTLTAIREFEEALAGLDTDANDRAETLGALMRDAIQSRLDDLRAELAQLAGERAKQRRGE